MRVWLTDRLVLDVELDRDNDNHVVHTFDDSEWADVVLTATRLSTKMLRAPRSANAHVSNRFSDSHQFHGSGIASSGSTVRMVGTERAEETNLRRKAVMNKPWEYQLRIDLRDDLAEAARRDPNNPAIKALADILTRHHATMKCQFDAFADYVAEAEKRGTKEYPLYAWTKATIEDPEKKAKYLKSFTLYVDGNAVYAKRLADAMEADLQLLIGSELIMRIAKYDTNPANNPQVPGRYRS